MATFEQQIGTANPFDSSGFDVGTRSKATFADLDNDGDLDVVVGEGTGTLNYFENIGSATEANFTVQTGTANPFDNSDFDVGTSSTPTLVDLDGDGDLDAVVGESDGILNYFENTGSATKASFTIQTDTDNPFDGFDVGTSSKPTLADLDGDGDLDAVVGEFDGILNYFENTGSAAEANFIERTGTANPFDTFDIGNSSAPTLADVDGDGDLDAVVGESTGTLNYFENTGSTAGANFIERTGTANPFDGSDFDVGSSSAPALADVDGDGDLDVVVGESTGTLNYFGNTTPVFISIPTQTATEDAAFIYTVPIEIFDEMNAEDSFILSATLDRGDPLPSWLSFNPSNRTFSGTPLNDDVGTISIRITTTGPSGETASTTFDLEVANTNDAPTLETAIADQALTEAIPFSLTVPVETFADGDANDSLTLTATLSNGALLPEWLAFDGTTFSGTPALVDVGTFAITVTATDLAGEIANTSFDVAIAERVPVSDFNADLKVDIVIRNLQTGEHNILNIDGNSFVAVGALPTVPSEDWFLKGIGDFDQDGETDDLVWHNDKTGHVETWNIDTPTLTSGVRDYFRFGTVSSTTGWSIQGVGDFDSDGYKDDLLWFDRSTGHVAMWMTEDGAISDYQEFNAGVAGTGWMLAEVGDFDGDGLDDDLLWRNDSTGDNGVWILDEGVPMEFISLEPVADLNWQIIGVSNFDGSGQTNDILWRNDATDMMAMWQLDESNGVVIYQSLGLVETQIQAVV